VGRCFSGSRRHEQLAAPRSALPARRGRSKCGLVAATLTGPAIEVALILSPRDTKKGVDTWLQERLPWRDLLAMAPGAGWLEQLAPSLRCADREGADPGGPFGYCSCSRRGWRRLLARGCAAHGPWDERRRQLLVEQAWATLERDDWMRQAGGLGRPRTNLKPWT